MKFFQELLSYFYLFFLLLCKNSAKHDIYGKYDQGKGAYSS